MDHLHSQAACWLELYSFPPKSLAATEYAFAKGLQSALLRILKELHLDSRQALKLALQFWNAS